MVDFHLFRKKIIVSAGVFFVIAAALTEPAYPELPANQTDGLPSTDVTVDASQHTGDMPEIFRTGVFETYEAHLTKEGRRYLQQEFFSELLPGMTTIFVPLWSESFDDFKRKVEKERLLEPALLEARKVMSNGGIALLDVSIMPRWLSSNLVKGEFWRYPPKNYKTWKDLVAYTAGYFYHNGVRGVSYRIWEEVDTGLTKELRFWNGTREEFYKLYKYSVEGIKSVDPDAKITFGLAGYESDILPSMAQYAATNNLPLDYIIWHPFTTPPFAFQYEYIVEFIKKVLSRAGYKKNAGIHAESWNSWLEFGKPNLKSGQPDSRSRERDTEYNAAYVVQSLFAQNVGGVTSHAFFDRIDHYYGMYLQAGLIHENQQFYGDWGMFTRDLVIKPVFNAFKILSLLYGKEERQVSSRLRAEFNETDFITAIASQTKDGSKIRVLLANYVPPDNLQPKVYARIRLYKHLRQYYGEALKPWSTCLSGNGSTKDCESLAPEDLRPFLSCLNANDKGKCSSDMPEHLRQFVQDTALFVRQQKEKPKDIVLSLKNIPFSGKISLETYTIDKDCSNSCRYNKSTERKPTGTECGIDGKIDSMIREARREAGETARRITKEHPSLYPGMKEIEDALFYFGEYALPDGRVIKNSMYVDKINNDPHVSLEGSKQVKEISLDKNGSFKETIAVRPYGIVLLEISPNKR